MTRRIVRRFFDTVLKEEVAFLECGHLATVPEWACIMKFRLNGLTCTRCEHASELPNNVREIWEKYWDGKRAAADNANYR